MKRAVKYIISLSFLFLFCGTSFAQISEIEDVLGIKRGEPILELDSVSRDADSIKIAELNQQIQQMKFNEIIYQEELDKIRSVSLSDSIRRARRIARIDSLRSVSEGSPIVILDDTLFTYYAPRGGVTASDRAANAMNNVIKLGKTRSVEPDSIYTWPLEDGRQIEIMYHNSVITSVTIDDAIWMNMSIDSLAEREKTAIVDAVKKLQDKHSMMQILKRIGLFILVIALQVGVIYMTNRLYRASRFYVIRKSKTKFKPIKIRDYEFLDTKREASIVLFLLNILRYVVIGVQLVITIPILFSIFPQTKQLATILFGYILTPVKAILTSVANYVPNLITIIIIFLAIRYLIKGIRFMAREVQNQRLKIPGFYPDWALPTFNIIKFLLYAFMIAMIYPHLPGAQSGVFQGISIFVGLLVSLGSSTAIANVVSGLVITYMRPFQLGDRIKLNETEGNVIEKTSFVTRIRTPKNEVVTIPNSFVLSSHTTNYSISARDYGLIIHATIGINYDVPRQKVRECLIEAAKATDGVMKDREPFVLELEFSNFAVNYQINVYIQDADRIAQITSDLHSNIQDIFNREKIYIETPLVTKKRDASAEEQKFYSGTESNVDMSLLQMNKRGPNKKGF